jgi:hypothetical protein
MSTRSCGSALCPAEVPQINIKLNIYPLFPLQEVIGRIARLKAPQVLVWYQGLSLDSKKGA